METKIAFRNFFNSNRKDDKNELKLMIWLSGEDVPTHARGKLVLNVRAINDLVHNNTTPVALRLHTSDYGDNFPLLGKFKPEEKVLEIRMGKVKGKEILSADDVHPAIVYSGITPGVLGTAAILMESTTKNFTEGEALPQLGGSDEKKETGKLDLASLASLF